MWVQPKTNWGSNDYFNIGDYNRIKNNLNEIRTLALTMWPSFDFEDMGADKRYSDYGFYAGEINRFEDNLDLLCRGTYPFAIGGKQIYYDNQPFIDYQELNRIERACFTIYNNIKGRINGRPTLAIILNGGNF